MTTEQKELLAQARRSLEAARLLEKAGHHGFAASRAYYAMFYAAEAVLLSKGLSFSKHAAVVAGFGEHFAKTGALSAHLHRYLIRALEIRHAGDYGGASAVTPQESSEQLGRATEFLDAVEKLIADC